MIRSLSIFNPLLIFFLIFLIYSWTTQITVDPRSNLFTYLAAFLFFFAATLLLLIQNKHKNIKIELWDLFPAGVIVAWIYGATLGYMHGNDWQLIARTFVGLLLYSFYYLLLLSKISKTNLIRCLLVVSITANITIIWVLSDPAFNTNFIIGQRILFTPIQLFCFLTVPLSTYSLISNKARDLLPLRHGSKIIFLILALFGIFNSAILSNSKGFHLSFIFILFCILLTLSRKVIFWSLVLGYCLLILTHLYPGHPLDPLYKIVVGIISPIDPSNLERYRQLYFLFNDITLLGRGLGSPLSNLYIRDPVFHYSYELSLLNIVHKMGIVSVLILSIYAITLHISLSNLYLRKNLINTFTAVGCFAFFFLGLGNPSLFAPEASILHSFALYLLRPDKSMNNESK